MTFDRENALKLGVKRGALIDFSLIAKHADIHERIVSWVGDTPAYGILALYDCALVDHDISDKGEPWVHILVAKEIPESEIQGNYTFGKNSKIIHFEASIGGKIVFLECSAIGVKIPIDRSLIPELLVPLEDAFLPNLKDILEWSCERVVKAVFSDEFNRDVKNKVEKVFNDARMKNITSILIQLDENALAEKDFPVEVKIALTCLDTLDPQIYQSLEQPRPNVKKDLPIADKVAKVLNDVTLKDEDKNDILTESGEKIAKYSATALIIAEGELPYSISRKYRKWSTDSLTLKEGLATTSSERNGCYPD